MIWAVDLELEDVLNEARLAAGTGDNKMPSSKEAASIMNKARRAQQNAEIDKQRIPAIVMKLLVCSHAFLSVEAVLNWLQFW